MHPHLSSYLDTVESRNSIKYVGEKTQQTQKWVDEIKFGSEQKQNFSPSLEVCLWRHIFPYFKDVKATVLTSIRVNDVTSTFSV